jgi:hypothetical protein
VLLFVRFQVSAVSVGLIATLAMTGCSSTTRRTLYWPAGAIFSERGDWVYFVIRKTDVTERGTPTSAQVSKGGYPLCGGCGVFDLPLRDTVWSDEISLRRIRLADAFTEELIHWPSTPRTGTTSDDVHFSFCYPAGAVMRWDTNHTLRIWISLTEGLQTTAATWVEGKHNEVTSFSNQNPGAVVAKPKHAFARIRAANCGVDQRIRLQRANPGGRQQYGHSRPAGSAEGAVWRSAAATTLLKTLIDASTPASVRVRAADSIFNHAAKAIEIEDIEARLSELERAAEASRQMTKAK